MVGAPVERLGARSVVAGEVRHDIVLVQLVGPFGLIEIGPVVYLLEERAEIALLCVQSLDRRDGIVRGADDAELVFDEPFGGVVSLRHIEAQRPRWTSVPWCLSRSPSGW